MLSTSCYWKRPLPSTNGLARSTTPPNLAAVAVSNAAETEVVAAIAPTIVGMIARYPMAVAPPWAPCAVGVDLRERRTAGQGSTPTGQRLPQVPTMRGAEPSTAPSLLLIGPDSTSRS